MDPTLCQPPPDLERWVRHAAGMYIDVKDGVRFVMRQTRGLANPQQVHEAIERLHRTEFPIHLISRTDHEDTLTYCDGPEAYTSSAVGPKSDNARLVTCVTCLHEALVAANGLAVDCFNRIGEVAPAFWSKSEFAAGNTVDIPKR